MSSTGSALSASAWAPSPDPGGPAATPARRYHRFRRPTPLAPRQRAHCPRYPAPPPDAARDPSLLKTPHRHLSPDRVAATVNTLADDSTVSPRLNATILQPT